MRKAHRHVLSKFSDTLLNAYYYALKTDRLKNEIPVLRSEQNESQNLKSDIEKKYADMERELQQLQAKYEKAGNRGAGRKKLSLEQSGGKEFKELPESGYSQKEMREKMNISWSTYFSKSCRCVMSLIFLPTIGYNNRQFLLLLYTI